MRWEILSIVFSLLLALFVSCSSVENDVLQENSVPEIEGNQSDGKDDESPEGEETGGQEDSEENVGTKSKVYVTGVEYPADYDWSSSMEPEGTEALLFLMEDGRRILDFLVGEEHFVYADPKRHRCIDGHIYSDFNAPGKTIVKKDGEILFVYNAEEKVKSWKIHGNDVFTLSEKLPSGVSMRKNGVLIYDNPQGEILSELYVEENNIGFCAGSRSASGEYRIDIYFGGKVEEYTCPDGISQVFAAEKVDGNLAYVAYSSDKDEYMLLHDGSYTVLERFLYDYIAGLRFLRGETRLFVYGELSDYNDNLCAPAVWTKDGLHFNFSAYYKSFSVCTDADRIYNFAGKQQYPQGISAYVDRKEKLFDYGYGIGVYSPEASMVKDGKLYFIYGKNLPYSRPCISVDGEESEYGFNGFFSGISAGL